jgi:flavin-dependent dehydrogenase
LREIGLDAVATRLENATIDEASVTGVSHFETGWQPSSDEPGRLVLGDSHSMIPPFTGAGMSMAFESAARSLPFLVEYANGNVAWPETVAKTQLALRRHFTRRMRWAGMLHRVLLSRAGPRILKTAVSSRLLPFDFMVRVLRGAA